MPLRSAGLSNTSLITATGTCAGRTLADRFAQDVASVEDWRGCSGDTSDTGTLNSAIAYVNAGTGRHVLIPTGTYNLEDLLDPITATEGSFVGQGQGTILSVASTVTLFDEIGTFWRLGTDAIQCKRFTIGNMRFVLSKTIVDPNVFAVRFDNALECTVEDITHTGIAGLWKIGTDTTGSGRLTIRNWFGGANQGLNSDANMLIRWGAVCLIDNIIASGGGQSTQGAVFKIDGLTDTVFVTRVSGQFFDAVTDTDGKPFGVFIDRSTHDITNLWFDNCVFDHTSNTAFRFADTGVGTDRTTRWLSLNNCRFSTETGRGFHLQNTAGGLMRGIKITNNTFYTQDNSPAFQASSSTEIDLLVSGNSFLDYQPTDNAVILSANGWRCFGNRIAGGSASTACVNAFAIQGTDTTDCFLGDNSVKAGITYVTQPPYTTPYSAQRIIQKPQPASVKLAANFTTTSTTTVPITGLAASLRPLTTYRLTTELVWQSSVATEGAGFAFANVFTTMFVSRFGSPLDQASSNSAPVFMHRRSAATVPVATASVDTINSDMLTIGTALLTTSAAATQDLTVNVLSEAGATITVKAGSFVRIEEV